MDPVAQQIARALGKSLAPRLTSAIVGTPEDRAMRRIIRESAAAAVSRFPAEAAISVDIDLVADDAVAEEVLLASVPGATPSWDASRNRWLKLYGTEITSRGAEFLSTLAGEMRPRLQRSRLLQGLWTAIAVERQATALGDLVRSVDGLNDPLLAIQKKQGRIGSDLGYAMSVANALSAAMGAGGASSKVDIRLQSDDGSISVLGRPGVEMLINVTKLVPDTDEGRRELQEIDEALKTGKPVDMGDVKVAMSADGVPIALPSDTGRVSVGRATRRLRILIDLASANDEVRLLFTGDSYIEGGRLLFTARSGNYGAIRAKLTLDLKTKRTTVRFFLDHAKPFTLDHQVIFQRVLAVMALGGRATVDFIDPPLDKGTATFEPNQGLADAVDAVEPLSRLAELQRLLGLHLPAVAGISGEDHALALWAIELVRNGRAAVAASGAFHLRGDSQMADELIRDAGESRRLSMRSEMKSYRLEMSAGIGIELGPIRHSIRDAELIGPTEVAPGVFEAQIVYGPEMSQEMERLTPESPADPPAR